MRGFTIASFIVLVLVVLVVGTAAVLLAKTVQNAQSINDKAQNIAKVGTGINEATDSVVQLTRTNKLAESILRSANPLERQLNGIIGEARSIDRLASSINGTAGDINNSATTIGGTATDINQSAGDINSAAGSINQSAGSIGGSAGAINTRARAINANAGSINASAISIDRDATSILGTGREINRDVSLINRNLDVSLALVAAVKGDTGNILGQAVGAHDTAACIDAKLGGSSGTDGDCRSQPTPTSKRGKGKDGRKPMTLTPDRFKKMLQDQAALRRRTAVPDLDVKVPDLNVKVPDLNVKVPDVDVNVPDPDLDGRAGGLAGGADRLVEKLFPGAFRGRIGSRK